MIQNIAHHKNVKYISNNYRAVKVVKFDRQFIFIMNEYTAATWSVIILNNHYLQMQENIVIF